MFSEVELILLYYNQPDKSWKICVYHHKLNYAWEAQTLSKNLI